MAIESPIQSRERILLMGGTGTGKSFAALSIAKRINGCMYVLDNDNAYDRMLETDFTELGNVFVYPTWDWESTVKAATESIVDIRRDDWLVVDILSPTWPMVQDWFSENVYGDDLATYMLRARQAVEVTNTAIREKRAKGGKVDEKETRNLQPFDGFMDWSVINPQYQKFMAKLRNCPAHVLCTAEVDAVDSKRDSSDVLDLYPLGVKPRGQKRTGHAFSTILLMSKRKAGVFEMTTVKDRGRKELDHDAVGDFGVNYLMRTAGWKAAV